jgi:cytochrome d ubiquinol oxidase subunit I
MVLAAYMATALGTACIHAWRLRRDPANESHRAALGLSAAVGAAVAILQPFSGDVAGRLVAEHQPAKLAAMEAHFETGPCAPLRIGGLPDTEARTVRYSLDIPCGLSVLAEHDAGAVVAGLDEIPRDEWPPVTIVHTAFQIMLGIGTALAVLGVWVLVRLIRRRRLDTPWLLRCLVVAGPLAFLAIQAGWTVTEVGRQPWIIQGVMRTADAVTPMPALVVPFTVFTLLYVGLAAVVVSLMRRITTGWTGREPEGG